MFPLLDSNSQDLPEDPVEDALAGVVVLTTIFRFRYALDREIEDAKAVSFVLAKTNNCGEEEEIVIYHQSNT